MNVNWRKIDRSKQRLIGVRYVILYNRSWDRGVLLLWPFAVCAIDNDSFILGFGLPWSKYWLKRWVIRFDDIELVVIDKDRMLVREDYLTLGQISANWKNVEVLEHTMIAKGVKVKRSRIAKVFVNRNRGPRT